MKINKEHNTAKLPEVVMDKNKCTVEKTTLKTLGFFLLPVALLFVVVANVVLPVLGIFFAMPLVFLNGLLIAAPRRQSCRLGVS